MNIKTEKTNIKVENISGTGLNKKKRKKENKTKQNKKPRKVEIIKKNKTKQRPKISIKYKNLNKKIPYCPKKNK